MTITYPNPRTISEDDFPAAGTTQQKLQFLLNFAVLAPSSHNTQPWLFRIEGDAIELYADWSRRLEVVDPHGRELIMSCGAALLHLQLAMRHFGREAEVETFLDDEPPVLLARVRLGEPYHESFDEQLLFEAMASRRTSRVPFKKEALPGQLINELEDLAAEHGVRLHVLTRPAVRQAIAALITEAEKVQFADPAFRRELAEWIRCGSEERQDGMPAPALGLSRLNWITPLAKLLVRSVNAGASQGRNDARLALEAPLLGVLASAGDTPADWLATGQALAHLLLLSSSWGASASFYNQPIELPHLRAKLQLLTSCDGLPQFLLRMGYSPLVESTPRRPIDDVLLDENVPWTEADLRSRMRDSNLVALA